MISTSAMYGLRFSKSKIGELRTETSRKMERKSQHDQDEMSLTTHAILHEHFLEILLQDVILIRVFDHLHKLKGIMKRTKVQQLPAVFDDPRSKSAFVQSRRRKARSATFLS